MKIIGRKDSRTVIVEIEEEEIAHVFDLWSIENSSLGELRSGKEINLDAGYDFRNDIRNSCKDMVEAMASFKKAQDSLLNFATMVCEKEKDDVIKRNR